MIAVRDAVTAAEAGRAQARAAHASAVAAAAGRPSAFVAAQLDAGAAGVAAAAEVESKRLALAALLAAPPTPASTSAEIAVAQADLNVAVANAEVTRLEGVAAVAAAVASGTAADVAAAAALAAAADGAAAAEIAARQRALDLVLAAPAAAPPTAAEIAAARADLAAAEANAATLSRAGAIAVADTQASSTSARADVSSAAAAVRAADRALANAEAALASWYGPAGRLADDLALAERRAGVQVPADELIFVSSAPVRVADLAVARGDAVEGALMTVTDSHVAIDGSLRLAEAPLVEPGMTVAIEEPDLGIAATGVVSRVAATPGTNGVDGFHIYFEVLVAEPPPTLVGASVRLTVPVETTGRGVLAVPLSALTLAADGSSRVQSARGGALRIVTVEPGLSADGFVEVVPVDGTLAPGDLVVIGFEQRVRTTP